MPALKRSVADAHPGLTLVRATSLQTLLEAPQTPPQLNAIVLALFGVAAVWLAAIGLFAIVATMVRQRAHELGIRMALAASAAHVGRHVMVRGLALAAAGVFFGMPAALAAGNLLSAILFEISPFDPATLVVVATLLLVVAAIATFVPARPSMRIDPMVAMRTDV